MLKQEILSSAWDAPSRDTAAGSKRGHWTTGGKGSSGTLTSARRGDAGNDSITVSWTCFGLQGQRGVPEGCGGQQATFQRIHTKPSWAFGQPFGAVPQEAFSSHSTPSSTPAPNGENRCCSWTAMGFQVHYPTTARRKCAGDEGSSSCLICRFWWLALQLPPFTLLTRVTAS